MIDMLRKKTRICNLKTLYKIVSLHHRDPNLTATFGGGTSWATGAWVLAGASIKCFDKELASADARRQLEGKILENSIGKRGKKGCNESSTSICNFHFKSTSTVWVASLSSINIFPILTIYWAICMSAPRRSRKHEGTCLSQYVLPRPREPWYWALVTSLPRVQTSHLGCGYVGTLPSLFSSVTKV
jgi:hypothetical protein